MPASCNFKFSSFVYCSWIHLPVFTSLHFFPTYLLLTCSISSFYLSQLLSFHHNLCIIFVFMFFPQFFYILNSYLFFFPLFRFFCSFISISPVFFLVLHISHFIWFIYLFPYFLLCICIRNPLVLSATTHTACWLVASCGIVSLRHSYREGCTCFSFGIYQDPVNKLWR